MNHFVDQCLDRDRASDASTAHDGWQALRLAQAADLSRQMMRPVQMGLDREPASCSDAYPTSKMTW